MNGIMEEPKANQNVVQKEPMNQAQAVIRVSLSADKLTAYIELDPPEEGGNIPTLKELLNALTDNKVSYGLDFKVLKELAQTPVYEGKIAVAKGLPPVNGENATCSFQFNIVKNFKPKEKPDGSIDFYDLDIVDNVLQGQVLCKITPPTKGTEGLTVTKERILPKSGKTIPPMTGKNTALSADGTEICATIAGQVEFDGKKIHVNDSYYIDDVDNSKGNIKVNGNLIINGTIMQGLSVEAGGNIEVKGTIHSVTLKSGGNIVLRSGITGSELSCNGDLTSRFIENCKVFVKGSVNSEYILHSQIRCGKSIKIAGSLSKFMGGSCLVGQDIIAKDIGSAAGVKTDLELGTDPGIIERQQEIQTMIPELEKQIQSLNPLINLLQQLEVNGRLPHEKKKLLEDILLSCETNRAQIEEAKKELQEINETVRTKGYGRVVCTGSIYPGTKVKIGNAYLNVTDTLKSASLYYDEGTIRQGSAF